MKYNLTTEYVRSKYTSMQNTKEKSVTVTRSVSLPSKVHAEISKRASKAGMGLSTYIRMIIIRALENGNG